ncbi:MAG: UbiA prenyltransferase family protein [SAR202 cluster bacterium]|nr:UbiA prenyltransferase family protein [SAR202 cluster bacterium]
MDKQKQYKNSLNAQIYGLVTAIFVTMRPKQWSKNLLIFFALLFSVQESWDITKWSTMDSMLTSSIIAFIIFSVISGAVYLINDVIDYEKDSIHPVKSLRPIAAGKLSKKTSIIAGCSLLVIGLTSSFLLHINFGWIAIAYISLMTSYSIGLKNIVLIDCFAISAGFVLRAIAGAAVVDVPISLWLYLCTALGALVIALGKRRSELTRSGDKAELQRSSLKSYSLKLIDSVSVIAIISTIIAYITYTFIATNLPDNYLMTLTIPMVIYGLLRYAYLVHFKNLGESPEDLLLSDKHLLGTVTIWIVVTALVLVIFR